MRRLRKKFKRPRKPWDLKRMEEEKELLKKYGLRRKKEIWKTETILRNYRRRARELNAVKNPEQEKILLDKLVKLGVLEKGQNLDDVLALTVNDFLERRLQTLVYKKGLANTIKHARQLIVHGHIAVDGRRIRYPSMLITRDLEDKIGFYPTSPFAKTIKIQVKTKGVEK